MKKISYVLVSRNDSYCGDSVGRLTNTLNHTGQILFDNDVLEHSEVVLVDWASPNPEKTLKDVLKLNSYIKKILKIVTVPKDIANKYQKDSPFSEVHSMNVGFRNMEGEYFARIDNDTLIGNRWIKWFYHDREKLNYDVKIAFSGRRNLSEDQSKESNYKLIINNDLISRNVEICHNHNHYSRLMPPGRIYPFYGGAVGIMLVRDYLYLEYKGFNEDLIYMNNMDTEFINRMVMDDNEVFNLSLCTDADFYHQHHARSDGAAGDITQPHAKENGKRKTNADETRYKSIENNNSSEWGLLNEELELFYYEEFNGIKSNNSIKNNKCNKNYNDIILKKDPDISSLDIFNKNKNVIYVIDARPGSGDHCNPGYDDMNWANLTLNSIHSYCEKYNIDLKILYPSNFSVLWDILKDSSFTFYQKSTFIKNMLVHYFMNTDYEKYALIDLDMAINRDAPNIFDVHSTHDFTIMAGFSPTMVSKNEIYLKRYFKAIKNDAPVYENNNGREVPIYNLNLGCYIMSKKIAEKLSNVLPKESEFLTFLHKFLLHTNPILEIDKEKKDFIDQDLMSYGYAKTNVLEYKNTLAWEWNANWEACFLKNKPFNFCHFSGKDGKLYLKNNINNSEFLNILNVQQKA